MAKTDWKYGDMVTEADMNVLGEEVNGHLVEIEDLGTRMTTAEAMIGTHSESIESLQQQVEASQMTEVTTYAPVNSLPSSQSGSLVFDSVKGRTLVNLIKNDDFTIAVKSRGFITQEVDGSYRFTLNTTDGFGYVAFRSDIFKFYEVGATYIAIVDYESGTMSSYAYANAFPASTEKTNNGNISRNGSLAIKFKTNSDWLSPYGYFSFAVNGLNGEYCYFRNLRVYKITQLDYDSLLMTEASTKYPYVNGIESVFNTEFKSVGENLFLSDNLEQGGIESTGGNNAGSTIYLRTKEYIPVKSNTNYCISTSSAQIVIFYYTNIKTYISYVYNNVSQLSFSTPSDCGYIRVRIESQDMSQEIMLNEGSTPLPYTPYQEQIISLQDVGVDELRSLPNGVVDEIRDGKLYKRIGKIALNGSLDWAAINDYTDWYSVKVDDLVGDIGGDSSIYPMVIKYDGSILKNGSAATEVDYVGVSAWSSGYLALSVSDIDSGWTTMPSSQDIKDYFDANPYTMYYVLENTEVTDINQPTLASFPNGTFYQEGTVLPTTTIKYPTNLSGRVDSMAGGLEATSEGVKNNTILLFQQEMRLLALEGGE